MSERCFFRGRQLLVIEVGAANSDHLDAFCPFAEAWS
jgi:hypothetical protein